MRHPGRESTQGEIVESEEHLLAFIIDEIAEHGILHEPHVLVGVRAHVLKGDFFLLFPVAVAQEEGAHLVFVVAYGIADSILEVQECGLGIDFDFSLEVVDFVGNNSEIENHIADVV